MSLFTIDPFIRRAVWAETILDILDKPISDPALFLSGVSAYRALDATLSHLFIFFGSRNCVHINPPYQKVPVSDVLIHPRNHIREDLTAVNLVEGLVAGVLVEF